MPTWRGIELTTNQVELAKVVEGEASGEPYKGKEAVAAVAVNRAQAKGTNVATQLTRSQFNGYVSDWGNVSDDSIRAAVAATSGVDPVTGGWFVDPTNGARSFLNPKISQDLSWYGNLTNTTTIGNHVFGNLPDRPQYSAGLPANLNLVPSPGPGLLTAEQMQIASADPSPLGSGLGLASASAAGARGMQGYSPAAPAASQPVQMSQGAPPGIGLSGAPIAGGLGVAVAGQPLNLSNPRGQYLTEADIAASRARRADLSARPDLALPAVGSQNYGSIGSPAFAAAGASGLQGYNPAPTTEVTPQVAANELPLDILARPPRGNTGQVGARLSAMPDILPSGAGSPSPGVGSLALSSMSQGAPPGIGSTAPSGGGSSINDVSVADVFGSMAGPGVVAAGPSSTAAAQSISQAANTAQAAMGAPSLGMTMAVGELDPLTGLPSALLDGVIPGPDIWNTIPARVPAPMQISPAAQNAVSSNESGSGNAVSMSPGALRGSYQNTRYDIYGNLADRVDAPVSSIFQGGSSGGSSSSWNAGGGVASSSSQSQSTGGLSWGQFSRNSRADPSNAVY